MNWYITKIVYQIICGKGDHTAQFDEQLRLVAAVNEDEALEKALQLGHNGEDVFCNGKSELVQWKFINVSELYKLQQLIDGAELYSRITEVDDAADYKHYVHQKSASIREKTTLQLLSLV